MEASSVGAAREPFVGVGMIEEGPAVDQEPLHGRHERQGVGFLVVPDDQNKVRLASHG